MALALALALAMTKTSNDHHWCCFYSHSTQNSKVALFSQKPAKLFTQALYIELGRIG